MRRISNPNYDTKKLEELIAQLRAQERALAQESSK